MAKRREDKRRKSDLLTSLGFVGVLSIYIGLHLGYVMRVNDGMTIFESLPAAIDHIMSHPFQLFPSSLDGFLLVLLADMVYAALRMQKYLQEVGTVENAHGDAEFDEDYKNFARKFTYDPKIVKSCGKPKWSDEDKKMLIPAHKKPTKEEIFACRMNSQIFANNLYLSLNAKWADITANSLVFGPPGSGKTRYYLKPNLLQANACYVVTDPSGDIMQSCGGFLKKQGYIIKCFNVKDMSKSCRFNPLMYIRKTSDIPIIVNCIQENTKGETAKNSAGDPFWDKAAQAYMCAIIGYLYEVLPLEQRNFMNMLELIKMSRMDENGDTEETDFDRLFLELEKADPMSYAVMQYNIFKTAPAKTALGVVISAGVLFSQFVGVPEFRNLTCADEMELDRMSDEKMAIFLNIPQKDRTYAWITAMLYSILFDLMYKKGEENMAKYGWGDPELKIPVRCLIDEARNIGKIPNLSEILATNRKYRLSLTLIFQSYPQIEEVYGKEQANEIFANCASKLVLGADDARTLQVFSEKLGKETVNTLSPNFGKSGTSLNKGQTGRELMSKTQMEQMSSTECLVFFQKLKPFKATRFDLDKHPNYSQLAESNPDMTFINPFELVYDDEYIESARIKKVGEDGYVEPKVIDSARRRAAQTEVKNRIEELKKMIRGYENGITDSDDPDEIKRYKEGIEDCQRELALLEAQLKAEQERQAQGDIPEESQNDKKSDDKPQSSDETKDAKTYEDDVKAAQSVPEIENASDLQERMKNVNLGELTIYDDYAFAYEFDMAKDFRIEPLSFTQKKRKQEISNQEEEMKSDMPDEMDILGAETDDPETEKDVEEYQSEKPYYNKEETQSENADFGMEPMPDPEDVMPDYGQEEFGEDNLPFGDPDDFDMPDEFDERDLF